MRFGNIIRLAAGAVSLLCMVGWSGCNVKFGTTPKDSDIIAKPSSGSYPEMEITFGEFNKQYQYYLKVNEIEDDTAAAVSADCKQRRTDIIENMILNKIYLQKARDLGIAELSAEDMAIVDEEYESQIEAQVKYYGEKALNADSSDTADSSTSEGSESDSASEEEIISKGNEVFDKLLADCGLTRDDLHRWLEEYLISANMLDESVKSVSRESAEEEFNKIIAEIKELYNSDDRLMYFQNNYFDYWIPEGSRMIKHVLLGFDEETRTQIEELRKDSKDDDADALRAEKAEEFADRIAEVNKLLDDNEDFNTILLYYSSDAAGSSAYPDGYLVTPNDPRWVTEFAEAAFVPEKPGDRTLCTSDFGVHIMIYASDAKVSEDVIKSAVDNIHGQLRSQEADKLIEQWEAEYNYSIDYEKLRIDPASTSGT